MFFPVRNTTQGKPCFHYRHGFAVCLLLLLGCAQGPVATSWVFDRFLRNNLKKTCHFIMGRKRTRTTEKNSANSDQNQSSISCPDPESITAQRVTSTDSEEKGLWPQPCSTFRFENSIFRLFWTKSMQKLYFVTKIVLTYCEKKIVLVIEKIFWKWRLKIKNLQNFWDH